MEFDTNICILYVTNEDMYFKWNRSNPEYQNNLKPIKMRLNFQINMFAVQAIRTMKNKLN